MDIFNRDLNAVDITEDIPDIQQPVIEGILRKVTKIFQNEETLLKIEGPIYVVGDLHGNLFDFFNILRNIGLPSSTKILFLGDYVDRGAFSLEVITFLLALKCAFPENVYMIRGNHEVRSVNAMYGFKEQVSERYDDELWEMFNKVFDYLPLAAIIDNKYFAVHGGLSSKLDSPEIIANIRRPLTCDFENEKEQSDLRTLILDLLWSDPVTSIAHFVPSPRGNGSCFGFAATKYFLTKNKLESIFRGHQCVEKGVHKWWEGLLYTVFSSSNYAQDMSNYAGVCEITENSINSYRMSARGNHRPNTSHKSSPELMIHKRRRGSTNNIMTIPVPCSPSKNSISNSISMQGSPLIPRIPKGASVIQKRGSYTHGSRSPAKISLRLSSFMF